MSRKTNFNTNQSSRPKSQDPKLLYSKLGTNSAKKNDPIKNTANTTNATRPYTVGNTYNNSKKNNLVSPGNANYGSTTINKPEFKLENRDNYHISTQEKKNGMPVKAVRGHTNEIMQKSNQNKSPIITQPTSAFKNNPKVVEEEKKETKPKGRYCCKICKKNFERIVKTPKCENDQWCKLCFEKYKNTIECAKCKIYLNSTIKNIGIKNKCLCGSLYPNKKFECHSFCETCYDFFVKNDIELSALIKCKNCDENFKKIKEEAIVKKSTLESPSKNVSEPVYDSPKKQEYLNSMNYALPLAENIPEQKKENIKACESCKSPSKKTFKIPNCKLHEYCEDCSKKYPLNGDCDSCFKFSYYMSNKTYYGSFGRSCIFCNSNSLNTMIKCASHKYCQVCCEFLLQNDYSHISKVARCPECNDSIKKSKSVKEPEKEVPIAKQQLSEPPKQETLKLNQYPEPDYATYQTRPFSLNLGHQSSSCTGCYGAAEKLYKTPRCEKHEYCNKCITTGARSICDYCKMYFESLAQTGTQNTFKCSLCKLSPEATGIKCNSHSYCKFCYDFLIKKDYSHILKVANCQECNYYINILKNPQANPIISAGTNEKLNTIQYNYNSHEEVKSNNYNTANRNRTRASSSNPGNRSSVIVSSKTCKGCFDASTKLFTTPRCKNHEYCSRCIQSAFNESCDLCKMYFDSLRRTGSSKGIFQCSLCKISPNSSDIKCSSHLYCNFCYEYLVKNDYAHIVRVANCKECSFSLNKIKGNPSSPVKNPEPVPPAYSSGLNQADNRYSTVPHQAFNPQNNEFPTTENQNYNFAYLQQDYSNKYQTIASIQNTNFANKNPHQRPYTQPEPSKPVLYNTVQPIKPSPLLQSPTITTKILPKCSSCFSPDQVKGFLCNHNICLKCLVKLCFYQINLFLQQYDQQKPQTIYKFTYNCTINSCNKPISVPTRLLINTLQKYLSDPNSHQEFSMYHRLVYGNSLDSWISYFDGLV